MSACQASKGGIRAWGCLLCRACLSFHSPAAPEDVKYELHVLLVEHGKRCPRCAKGGKNRQSSHGECPLTADNLRLWRDGLGAKGAGGGGAAGGIAAKEEDCKVGVGPLSEGPGEGALPLKDEGARKGRRLD